MMTETRSPYNEAIALGFETDHHESDLYVRGTKEALEWAKSLEIPCETFSFGYELWIEFPFSYEPFWESKQ